MRAGPLNKRALFQQLVTVSDGAGGSTTGWGNDLTVWAQLQPERAREKIRQGRISDSQAGVLRVRSSTATRAIDGTWRVTVGGVVYNIRSHDNVDQTNDVIEMIVEVDGTVPTGNTP